MRSSNRTMRSSNGTKAFPRRAAPRGVAIGVSIALAVVLTPIGAAADVRSFARICAAPESTPGQVLRFCTKALETKRLGAKAQAQVLVNRGVAFSTLDRAEDALADYDAAARLYPRLFETWPNRGRTLLRLRRFAEAFESYDRALALRPDDLPSLVGRGAALVSGGAANRSLADFDRALELEPMDPTARYNRGLAYVALGRLYEAAADFSEVLAIRPNDVDARLQRGRLREEPYRRGALMDYQAAIASAPDDPRPYYHRGRFLDRLGETDRADADLKRAWDLGFRDEWLHERIITLGG